MLVWWSVPAKPDKSGIFDQANIRENRFEITHALHWKLVQVKLKISRPHNALKALLHAFRFLFSYACAEVPDCGVLGTGTQNPKKMPSLWHTTITSLYIRELEQEIWRG